MKIPTTLPLTATKTLSSRVCPVDEFSLRRRLLDVLQPGSEPPSGTKTAAVEKVLAPYLAAGQLPASVLVDYAAVHQAAARQDKLSHRLQSKQELDAEEEQLVQVAALLPDTDTLSAYWEEQAPFLEEHWQQVGLSDLQIKKRLQALHKRLIKGALQQALVSEDWNYAACVLTHFRREFTSEEQRVAGIKIRQLYAREKAAALWLQAAEEGSEQPAVICKQAEAKLQEPDEELADSIRAVLHQICRQQEIFLSAQRQALYEQLAGASAADMAALLNGQQCLTAKQLADAQYALAQLDETKQTNAKWFAEQYVSPSAKILQKALYKNTCSVRDYFRLSAREEACRAGVQDEETALLVRAVAVWSEKKGIPEEESWRLTYYLLTRFAQGQPRWEGWKNIQQQLAV